MSLVLASKPHFLENCPVIGSRTASVFFELLKFCTSPKKNFWKTFFSGNCLKKFLKTFFLENTCAWVLGLERVCSRKGCPWPRIFLCSWPWPRALCSRYYGKGQKIKVPVQVFSHWWHIICNSRAANTKLLWHWLENIRNIMFPSSLWKSCYFRTSHGKLDIKKKELCLSCPF